MDGWIFYYNLKFKAKNGIKPMCVKPNVFASEIFTAISQISEEPPEVIHINKMPWKELAIFD